MYSKVCLEQPGYVNLLFQGKFSIQIKKHCKYKEKKKVKISLSLSLIMSKL
jgi:hypothetical protein